MSGNPFKNHLRQVPLVMSIKITQKHLTIFKLLAFKCTIDMQTLCGLGLGCTKPDNIIKMMRLDKSTHRILR